MLNYLSIQIMTALEYYNYRKLQIGGVICK